MHFPPEQFFFIIYITRIIRNKSIYSIKRSLKNQKISETPQQHSFNHQVPHNILPLPPLKIVSKFLKLLQPRLKTTPHHHRLPKDEFLHFLPQQNFARGNYFAFRLQFALFKVYLHLNFDSLIHQQKTLDPIHPHSPSCKVLFIIFVGRKVFYCYKLQGVQGIVLTMVVK